MKTSTKLEMLRALPRRWTGELCSTEECAERPRARYVVGSGMAEAMVVLQCAEHFIASIDAYQFLDHGRWVGPASPLALDVFVASIEAADGGCD